jgi:hypothetical protein
MHLPIVSERSFADGDGANFGQRQLRRGPASIGLDDVNHVLESGSTKYAGDAGFPLHMSRFSAPSWLGA